MVNELNRIFEQPDPVDVVISLLERVQKKFADGHKPILKASESAVLHLFDLDAEINNGGFHQYFFNSAGDDSKAALDALNLVGAQRIASILEMAVSLFGLDGPSSDQVSRQNQLDQFSEEQLLSLESLDMAYYNSTEDLMKLIADHCRRNHEKFRNCSAKQQ
jgi:hypothetical protein